MLLWFFTDLHGSEQCLRKLIKLAERTEKRPDIVVLGGDLTGKAAVPIVKYADKKDRYHARWDGQEISLDSAERLKEFQRRVAAVGSYPFVCTENERRLFAYDATMREATLARLQRERLVDWLARINASYAPKGMRLFASAGNDDDEWVNEVIGKAGGNIECPEGRVVHLGSRTSMFSVGFSNITPFHTTREKSEDDLRAYIAKGLLGFTGKEGDALIFNFHCPPFGTPLDLAPKLDENLRPTMGAQGPEHVHVGSDAVLEAIKTFQPTIALHGHVHESSATCVIGSTTCFNPGSQYMRGELDGVLVEISEGSLVGATLTEDGTGDNAERVRQLRHEALLEGIKKIPLFGFIVSWILKHVEDDL